MFILSVAGSIGGGDKGDSSLSLLSRSPRAWNRIQTECCGHWAKDGQGRLPGGGADQPGVPGARKSNVRAGGEGQEKSGGAWWEEERARVQGDEHFQNATALWPLDFLVFVFWLHHTACRLLAPQPGIKPHGPCSGSAEV